MFPKLPPYEIPDEDADLWTAGRRRMSIWQPPPIENLKSEPGTARAGIIQVFSEALGPLTVAEIHERVVASGINVPQIRVHQVLQSMWHMGWLRQDRRAVYQRQPGGIRGPYSWEL